MLSIKNVIKLLDIRSTTKIKDAKIQQYAIDSRTCVQGALFFAILGERTDGHRYLEEAKRNGALAYVVDMRLKDDQYAKENVGKGCAAFLKNTKNVLFVDDTLHALQSLAQSITQKKNDTTIAITGSCGKTTVKDLLVHALSTKFKVGCNKGNLNNHIGAPLSVLNSDWDNGMYVAEIGASKRGDIDELCSIVQPDLGIITNISPAHLEGFGTLEKVYETKAEMANYLVAHGGTIIADADDERLMSILDQHRVNRVTFGIKKIADYKVTDIEECGHTTIMTVNRTIDIPINIFSVLNVKNALAVIATTQLLGLPLEGIKQSFATFMPPEGRFMQIKKGAMTIVHDCYNANPSSFANALDLFSKIPHQGRKVLVCADMLELGEKSRSLHKDVGKKVSREGFEVVVGIGEGGRYIVQECEESSGNGPALHCADTNEAALSILKEELKDDDLVLFKASRGMRLEEIIEKL